MNENRVIFHLDLDAFYAQVEHKRTGIARDVPMAVQQWQGLIAVNYPARAFGIKRHVRPFEAKKLCPSLQLVHVASYRKNETEFAYHQNAHPTTHKVSLDPYRNESRKIMRLISSLHPVMEKASVDEVYIDVTDQVQKELEHLSIDEQVNWDGLGTILPGEAVSGEEDRRYLVAARMALRLREAIRSQLEFTVSVGVAPNKTLAKLCSSMHKPDQQAILRPSAVVAFIGEIPVKKVRFLGGKLGDDLNLRNIHSMKDLWSLDAALMQVQFPHFNDKTIEHLLQLSKGICHDPVRPRMLNNSFLAAKSLRTVVSTAEELIAWLRTLSSEVARRCQDEQQGRWPKQMTVSVSYTIGQPTSAGNSWMTEDPNDISTIHDEDEVDETRKPSNSKEWSRSVPAPHPESLKTQPDRLFKSLRLLIEKEFGNAHTLAPSKRPVFRWIGLKAHNFADIPTNTLMKFFTVLPRDAKKVEMPSAVLNNVEKKDEAIPNPENIDREVVQISDSEPEVEVDEQEFMIVCEKCGVQIRADTVEEHDDWHVAKQILREQREENQRLLSERQAVAAAEKRKQQEAEHRARKKRNVKPPTKPGTKQLAISEYFKPKNASK